MCVQAGGVPQFHGSGAEVNQLVILGWWFAGSPATTAPAGITAELGPAGCTAVQSLGKTAPKKKPNKRGKRSKEKTEERIQKGDQQTP